MTRFENLQAVLGVLPGIPGGHLEEDSQGLLGDFQQVHASPVKRIVAPPRFPVRYPRALSQSMHPWHNALRS